MEKELVEKLINELFNRNGFDNWWGDIDTEIKEEIKIELENIIKLNNCHSNHDFKIQSWDDGGCSTGLNDE